MLPGSLLREVQAELLDLNETDCSMTNVGLRSDFFVNLLHSAEKKRRYLMAISEHDSQLFSDEHKR